MVFESEYKGLIAMYLGKRSVFKCIRSDFFRTTTSL